MRSRSTGKLITIVWESIREPHLHGERATVGNRYAEVVRAYPGQWFAYRKLNGAVVQRASDEPTYESKSAAKKRATAFLRG